MAADYSKTHSIDAPQSSTRTGKRYQLHLLRFSGVVSAEWNSFHKQELCVAKSRKNIHRQQFLVSRLFIKQLYFADRMDCWSEMQVGYQSSLNTVCLYTAEKVLHKFGLSHSGDMICVFDAQRSACGVDVQIHNKKQASLCNLIGNLPSADQHRCKYTAERFYDLWVLKEAYAKLTGRTALQAFSLPTEHIWQRCYSTHISQSKTSIAVAIDTRPEQPVQIHSWYFDGHSFHKLNSWLQNW